MAQAITFRAVGAETGVFTQALPLPVLTPSPTRNNLIVRRLRPLHFTIHFQASEERKKKTGAKVAPADLISVRVGYKLRSHY
jgi:hypothetical protein